MSDKLVKRLRMANEYLPLGHDGWEAADRIEELEAERYDYAFLLAEANNTYGKMHVALEEANDKLSKSEALLAEAEEALDFYATCDVDGDQDRCGYDGALCCLNARSAVASLRGRQDMSDHPNLCPSCREPLYYPSGDGCAAMTKHKPVKGLANDRLQTDP